MEWPITLFIILGSLLILILSGFPIAFCFFSLCMVGVIIFWGGISGFEQYILSVSSSVTKFELVPVVLFILMGAILFESKVGTNLINTVNKCLGRLPGRLGIVSVITGTIFAALSGSSMASTAVLGSVLTPEMEKYGYRKAMSLGSIMAGGSLAMMIPPSGLGVFIAVLAKCSVGAFLIGIIIPGLILAFLFGAYIFLRSWLWPEEAPPYETPSVPLSEKLMDIVKYVLPLVVVIFLVTGIIMIGIATPSEAAATGCLGAFAVSALYKGVNWRTVKKSTVTTVRLSGMILLIMAASSAFTQVLAFSGVNQGMTQWIMHLQVPPIVTVIGILLIVMLLGCFMPSMGIVVIVLPLFGPIVTALHLDMVWFAILIMVNCEMGALTPPFGNVLFVMKGVAPADTTMVDVYKAALPLCIINIIVMVIILLFPATTLWLPGITLAK
ncbi:MAG: TRAP transporter large permease subunit [Deltaproteobacteria bacterium]|nr:TRAP transporter large permease subunit [Deltaproteobacteria bacterium]